MPFIRATATLTMKTDAGQFLRNRVTPAAIAGVTAFAEVAHAISQELVHVKTGRLKASGTEEPFGQDEPGGIRISQTDDSVRADIAYTAPYASFVEFRFPFLRPSLDQARDEGLDQLKIKMRAGFTQI